MNGVVQSRPERQSRLYNEGLINEGLANKGLANKGLANHGFPEDLLSHLEPGPPLVRITQQNPGIGSSRRGSNYLRW